MEVKLVMSVQQTIFQNADYLVIEYIDMIKSPYILLLDLIRRNDKLRNILKLEEIDELGVNGLVEWYMNRKNQNFLIDLCKDPDIPKSELDKLLDSQLSLTDIWFTETCFLNLSTVLRGHKLHNYTNGIIVYYPHTNMIAQKDMEAEYDISCRFVKTFEEAVDIAGSNSTYFLSNIDNVNILKEKDKLQFSSIVLPVEYRYNRKNMKDFKIDLNALSESYAFKIAFMRACSYFSGEEK